LNSQSIGKYQKVAIRLWVVASLLLTLGLVGIADSRSDSAIQLTDYVSAFYLAGKIVNQNDAVSLYPHPTDLTLRGAPFDVLGHKYLPATSSGNFFLFMYPPLVALMFAPLALLTDRTSLLIWQLATMVLMLAAAYAFKKSEAVKQSFFIMAASAYTLFCVMHNLVIGQIVVLIGVIPLTAGWLLWRHQKNFRAGLAFSIIVLKPQLLIPIVVLPVAALIGGWLRKDQALVRSNLRLLAGMTLGVLLIFGLQICLAGVDSLVGWLRCLRLVNSVVVGESSTPWANHLFLSLPGLLGTTLNGPFWQRAMPSLQGGLLISAALFLGFTSNCIWKSGFSADDKKRVSLVCLYALIPLMAVYLRDYDYAILLPAMWVVFFAMNRQSPLFAPAYQFILWTIAILNLQMILFLLLQGSAYALAAWFTAIALSLVGVRLCLQLCRLKQAEKVQP